MDLETQVKISHSHGELASSLPALVSVNVPWSQGKVVKLVATPCAVVDDGDIRGGVEVEGIWFWNVGGFWLINISPFCLTSKKIGRGGW